MLYLLAAIGAICVVVLLWRAFVANPTTVSERRVTRPTRPSRPSRRTGPIAPDDDPEFLRSLNERKNPPDTDDKQPPA
ncbi:hypothetical protein [Actinophytocola algeriensis]|jgi:hypothetical protein|uniref:Uncharacterized protein n=1 Tax=Actinophytocola algeriensis TaxID=1768010 RepID=A0A7W7VIR6_9PSEU|nr:hypothetical protein [Actinophytocola algeriensis]MBB4911847.1 hypothetical protein [Actinophytocola algeriensis]MBE1477661.1 hypothetical protein [Actinophytocola algeriensis]